MANGQPNCNCFSGTAYLTADNQCGCTDAAVPAFPFEGSFKEQEKWRTVYLPGKYPQILPPIPAIPGPVVRMPRRGGTVNNYNYYQIPVTGTPPLPIGTIGKIEPQPQPAADNKIFGFSPLVVLGAAAVGLYILSSMDGKK